MDKKTLLLLLLLTPFVAGAPSEERLPSDGFLELYNLTVAEENAEPEEPLQSKNVTKASMTSQSQPPQITIPIASPNIPLVFPRPFAIPFPFPFPPPPPPPQFPNVQVIAIPRPQKNLQVDDDNDEDGDDDDDNDDDDAIEEEGTSELIFPVEIPIDTIPEARRAPQSDRRKKKQKKEKKQKKQKKPKKEKKQKKQKKQKKPKYPQPIIIYQNQEEQPIGNEITQPGMLGTQGTQSSYLGYYMVYVVEVRWTGNNYTQTVVTGRPIPAAITIPPTTDSGVINNLSETIVPANLVNGNRPQTTPTCLFQRSTTTEHFGTQPEVFKPLESTDTPVSGGDEVNENENQEQIGEEVEDSEELDTVEDEYEDDSDPKRKKKKEIQLMTSSTNNPKSN